MFGTANVPSSAIQSIHFTSVYPFSSVYNNSSSFELSKSTIDCVELYLFEYIFIGCCCLWWRCLCWLIMINIYVCDFERFHCSSINSLSSLFTTYTLIRTFVSKYTTLCSAALSIHYYTIHLHLSAKLLLFINAWLMVHYFFLLLIFFVWGWFICCSSILLTIFCSVFLVFILISLFFYNYY